MRPNYYNIATNGRSADIYIFGDICGRAFEELGEQSAVTISDRIKNLDVDEINVHIDSYGGEVKEAWGMFNALREHPATINTYADGFVASAAIYPFLAGTNRYANGLSAFFLHEVIGGANGYADDLRKAADDIDFMTNTGVNAFVEVAGMDRENVLELMKNETWLDSNRAKELGIATELTDYSIGEGFGQTVRKNIVQQLLNAKNREIGKPEEAEPPRPEKINKLKNFIERV